jgi:hypothetical protein
MYLVLDNMTLCLDQPVHVGFSCVHHYSEQGVYDVDHKGSLEGESACVHPMRISCNECQIINSISYGLTYMFVYQ